MKLSEVDRSKLSPMMAQYMEIKDKYKDELVFYRLGDFYEMFFDDALIASRELELTLTGRVAGLEEKVPMCGVPHASVKTYIEKLVNKGYKVAICEQLEDPRYTKGMVKRGIVDVISKGTIADNDLLNDKDTSYIASILFFSDSILLTILDISTSYLATISIENNEETLINEILELNLKEVILVDNLNTNLINLLKNTYNVEVTINNEFLWDKYKTLLESIPDARVKSGVAHLFYYLDVRQLKDLSHITKINYLHKNDYLEMDIHSIRNLELVETLRLKERTYSLVWLLDKCKTAMGSRKLKSWMLNPLKNKDKINERYDKIEKLNNEFIIKDELKNLLYEVYDIERLSGKVINGSLNARDLLQLKNSIKVMPMIKEKITTLGFDYSLETHEELFKLLDASIVDEPPISIKEGYMIKTGFNSELDELRNIRSGGKDFVAAFEAKVKEETGIKSLKVGFNKVFGYFIEIPNGSKNLVKDEYHWERRQTLTNCERYISPELKEKESMILNAEENIIDLEYKIFCDIKNIVKQEVPHLNAAADVLGELDALVSLSVCSEEYNLVRPNITDEHIIDIKNGRHPVVEVVSKLEYVPNDCELDNGVNTLLITGPNMSGKSTFMRQLAIIVIMAQMGSFVPCESATLPIIDKIFTRIGASDDLVSGESTFMVEMKEARNAIHNATANSLILFDELGRGTATYDGMSLAQAILEYISDNIKSFTLFSTHYHELTRLDKKYKNIKNVHVSAVENGNEITFLHKVKNGAVDKSYGIHVARLAKMPDSLLKRADEILNEYESNAKKKNPEEKIQLTMDFETNVKKDDIIKETIENIDVLNTTPMEALNVLFDLKQKIKKGE
ncbi:MAG: DNA mismatch repair protein MutS [Firmicutes bacterium]|jgi:DNA mismatch repair protein mutS|uniref:DNA mismatch repair protein MutS n=1 Tax=Candidatus Onthocola sp. TaxID=3085646 RepID=UPI0024244613|nr:DNA mismatch repair protein MutS [Bacillota bacterium]